MPTRRHVLAAVGVAVGTAGCSQGGTSGSDGLNAADTATQLGEIQLQNDHSSAHEIQLAVETDEQMVHLATYSLDENNSTQVDGEWMDTPGAYQVHARLDDDTIRTISLSGETTDCTRILIRIDTDGTLSIWNGSCAATDAPTSN